MKKNAADDPSSVEEKDGEVVPSSLEEKRQFETARKRKYRAEKLKELIDLEAESRRLGAYLAQLQAKDRARRLARAKKENARLRLQVNQNHCLTPILSPWAHLNDHPPKAISHRTSWIETTLLANPISRKMGIQWLSERVYHQACRFLPLSYPNRRRVDDDISLDVHVSEDIDEAGITIAALETRYRYTTCTNFYAAARIHWGDILGEGPQFSQKLLDKVDDRFLYYLHENHRMGTSGVTIAGFFQDVDKVVITSCFLAKDELLPLGENAFRPHGFNWTVYEAVTPDITLVQNLALQYSPITANGKVIPLDKIGRLFGRSPDGIQYRETYIEQIRSAAEATYVSLNKPLLRCLSARMEKAANTAEVEGGPS
ncbi:hypothetical protein LEN26_020688 [Aphanomyces euteiches]|nr:hypothetical protein LEN26_020688 [Aphanomyces euteiches]